MAHVSPVRWHLLTAFIFVFSGTLALWWLLSGAWAVVPWALSWLGSVNVHAFAYYGVDKRLAREGMRRIPEKVLHALAAAGGSLGAFLGMRFFRHKTIKGEFRFVFWSIILLQLALAAWLLKLLFWG